MLQSENRPVPAQYLKAFQKYKRVCLAEAYLQKNIIDGGFCKNNCDSVACARLPYIVQFFKLSQIAYYRLYQIKSCNDYSWTALYSCLNSEAGGSHICPSRF